LNRYSIDFEIFNKHFLVDEIESSTCFNSNNDDDNDEDDMMTIKREPNVKLHFQHSAQ